MDGLIDLTNLADFVREAAPVAAYAGAVGAGFGVVEAGYKITEGMNRSVNRAREKFGWLSNIFNAQYVLVATAMYGVLERYMPVPETGVIQLPFDGDERVITFAVAMCAAFAFQGLREGAHIVVPPAAERFGDFLKNRFSRDRMTTESYGLGVPTAPPIRDAQGNESLYETS